MEAGSITIKTDIDSKNFDAQIEKMETKLEKLEEEYSQMYERAAELAKKQGGVVNEKAFSNIRAEIEKTKNSLFSLYEKQQQLDFGNVERETKKINFNLDNIIKKVTKWGLAIFGVRSAYMFIRQAMSTLSQYNKNLAKDIQNIRYGLASSMQPIIERIVKLAYKFMQAINYIWKVMTGKNLFSNMKKDLNSSNKSAKELKKTMAGFDEMNTLSDNTSIGGDSDIGKITEDLTATNLLSEETKKKLEAIAEVLKTLWTDVLKPLWNDILKPIGEWLLKNPDILIGLIVTILGFKLVSKIGGLATAIGTSSTGLIGALALLDVYLVTKVVKGIKEELIPTIKETKKGIKEAIDVTKQQTINNKNVSKSIVEYSKKEDANTDTIKKNSDYLLKNISTNNDLIRVHKDDIKWQGKLTGENKMHKEVIKECTEEIWDNIKALGSLAEEHKLTEQQTNLFIMTLNNEIGKLELENQKLDKNSEKYKTNKEKIGELKEILDKTKGTYNVDVKTKADKTKVDELKNSVNKVEGSHTITLKAETTKANKTIGDWLKSLGQSIVTTLMPDISWSKIKKKFGFAKGGIINMPGRGVPLSSAVGGERGAEGVVPLTDSQQMALLGEAIGKYINLNATIPVYVGNRQVAREIRKIEMEDAFMSNR